jgi:hypothetical protein
MAAGQYYLELWQGDVGRAQVEITVTSSTPVPETSSTLILLLPALLVGIYVLERRKNTKTAK